MSAPSLRNITQTPQRELRVQRYNKKMTWARKVIFFTKNMG